ncbi:MAG: prolyl oligopeptidase family serine peptidase [Bdellovibrionales bacterium]
MRIARVFGLGLFLGLLGCAHSNRQPSAIFDVATNEELAMLLKPDLMRKGQEEPWYFTQGFHYCEQSFPNLEHPDFANLTDQALEKQDSQVVQSWVRALNARTFKRWACDSRYKALVRDVFQKYQNPRYRPARNPKDPTETIGFEVKSFQSMASVTVDKAIVKSLAQVPRYSPPKDEESESNNIDQDFFREADVKDFHGYFLQSFGYYNGCLHRAFRKSDLAMVAQIWTGCTRGTLVETFPIEIKGKLYFVYSHFDSSGPESSFVLKLHRIGDVRVPEHLNPVENQKTLQEDANLVRLSSRNQDELFEIDVPTGVRIHKSPSSERLSLVLQLLSHGQSQFRVYEFDEEFRRISNFIRVPFPKNQLGKIERMDGSKLLISSYSKPNGYENFSYDLESREFRRQAKSPHRIQDPRYVTRVFLYPADDGEQLPISITHTAEFETFKDGNFGVLKAYGGFNIITFGNVRPHYEVILKRGGFVAEAILRGGGEAGVGNWIKSHGTGKKMTIDDFNAAASFLAKSGFANKGRIVSEGWSWGGLLVLSAAQLRPDLYGAVISGSPVTDVPNLERLDGLAGISWLMSDYGDLKDPQVKAFWQAHSPYQSLPAQPRPPPILLRTAYGDPNVNPGHALKLFRRLYVRPDRDKFYLFVQPHGENHGPFATRAKIEEYSYIFRFALESLGIRDP